MSVEVRKLVPGEGNFDSGSRSWQKTNRKWFREKGPDGEMPAVSGPGKPGRLRALRLLKAALSSSSAWPEFEFRALLASSVADFAHRESLTIVQLYPGPRERIRRRYGNGDLWDLIKEFDDDIDGFSGWHVIYVSPEQIKDRRDAVLVGGRLIHECRRRIPVARAWRESRYGGLRPGDRIFPPNALRGAAKDRVWPRNVTGQFGSCGKTRGIPGRVLSWNWKNSWKDTFDRLEGRKKEPPKE